ncbi:MAG: pyridoxine 5'-phosphate synthase [Desulfocapsaceae bacterium]|nr:pyridoxine 5'-phosphate synthase [Desulfocapsaceae bacterium]
MPVHIASQYTTRHHHSNIKYIRQYTNSLLLELGLADREVGILLTDDQEIAKLNAKYRDKNSPTNVLAFPFSYEHSNEIAAFPHQQLGDLVISTDTASEEAIKYKQSISYRMCWLITHGVLHLHGYDHERSSEDERLMQAKEQELLNKLFHERSHTMPQLAINVDHVSTLRQARGGSEPDPILAASICELAGASGIVVHLREDRRHIQDSDVYLLRKTVKTKLNLEMGANPEIIDIALDVVPDMITLVPEKRQELTTEGGLDVISQQKKLAKVVKKFNKANIPVSIFVDPDLDQIRASHDIGAKFVEIHTGRYCDAESEEIQNQEFELIASAADEAYQLGLVVNGGHGLDYHNTGRIASLDAMEELSIGHAVISRAVFTGLEKAVKDMLDIIRHGTMQIY